MYYNTLNNKDDISPDRNQTCLPEEPYFIYLQKWFLFTNMVLQPITDFECFYSI